MTRRNSNRHTQIGLDRLIRLDWMQRTVDLVLAGNDVSKVESYLDKQLKMELPSTGKDAVRGTRSKVITILTRTWVRPPAELEALRVSGLSLMRSIPSDLRIAIHWGMIGAAYPFWARVAANIGRLLKLQDTVAASQVQRRMREEYGERETVSRRARYLIRTFVDWGVLEQTPTQGIYVKGPSLDLGDPNLIAWLAEASLHACTDRFVAAKDILESPSMFPFHLAHISAENIVSHSQRLDVLRQGLDDDLLTLRGKERPK